MTLSDLAIRRPVLTTVVTVGLMVMGLLSFRNLGTDLFPDVNFPVVTINTIYPGASPDEVERQLTKPIEDAVAGIAGLDTVRSFSRESLSTVIVLFKLSANIDEAATDVRERVAAIRGRLPTDVREPTIQRVDVSAAPISVFVASGENMSDAEVRRITEDDLKPALERVPGVAAVNVIGGREREVQVAIHREALARLGLPLTAVADVLRLENIALPAGSYEEGPIEYSVRLRGDLQSAEEVADLIVGKSAAGTQIRLSEIADVSDGFADVRTRIRANGEEAVAFEIQKQSGSNTVEVARAVNTQLQSIAPTLPKGYSTKLIIDTSEFILENTEQVEGHILYGGAMAILIILLFMLDFRSTIISALALPTSVIATFIVLDALDYTLNMMTLMGLSLSIGLLIDDAVVVRESIFRRLEMGESPKEAAAKGTSEIAFAVLATTLTVVAVFIPVAFMQGVVGQFFKQFGFTVSAAVLMSLFIAFTLDPMLSAHFAAKVDPHRKRSWPVRMMEAIHRYIEDVYAAVLQFSVRHKFLTVLLGIAVFMGSTQLTALMGSDFVAPEDRAQYMVTVELPAGTTLDETGELLRAAELKHLEDPNFVTLYSKLGPNMEVNKARWRVVTTPKTERTVTLSELQDRTRAIMAELAPTAKISIEPPAFVEGLEEGAPLQVQIRGTHQDQIERHALAVERMVRSISGVSDVRVQYSPGKPEQVLTIDRKKAADLGVPIAMVARTLRTALDGEEVGQLRLQSGVSKEVKIRLRLREQDREHIEKLTNLPLATPKGTILLGDILHIQPASGPQVIERQDRTRQIVISGVPTTRSLGEIVADLTPQLDAHDFGEGGYYKLEGQVKQMKETGEAMGLALALAVLFIYLILAAQFESFMHPFTIMLSLPLAFVGAFVALFMTDASLSMGSNIGIILLMGLVTKNAILLVDAALEKQREGMAAKEAVIDAGLRRLRPILMTSAAMILGMLPTAISQGPGSEFRSPMGIAVIGGVITSTILTLVVVPAVFLWLDGLSRLFFRGFRKLFPPQEVVQPLLFLLTAASVLLIPTRPTIANPLSLEEAQTRAVEVSPDLAAAQSKITATEAARRTIMTTWYPDLKAVASYTRNSEEATFDTAEFVTGLAAAFPGLPPIDPSVLPEPTVIQKKDTLGVVFTVDQNLFVAAPLFLTNSVDASVAAQQTGLAAAQREIRFRVAEMVYSIAGVDRLLAVVQQALELSETRLAQAKARYQAGADIELSVLRAETDKTRALVDIEKAKAARHQLLAALGVLLQTEPPTDIVPPPDVADPGVGASGLIESAYDNRLEIVAVQEAAQATEALIEEAQWRWLPILNLQAYLRWSNTAGFTGEEWTWAITGNLVFPLYDRGLRYAEANERRAQQAAQLAEIGRVKRDVAMAIRQSDTEVQAAKRSLALAKQQTTLTRKTAEILEQAYKSGGVNNFEYTEAMLAVRLAEQNETQQHSALQLALLRLRHAAGM
ncbi:MAG: efflux RND transporter permease subunit [Myxococcales bacterium]|nr:efflux RND transporter permease subunit [Myxococcales bacterium]